MTPLVPHVQITRELGLRYALGHKRAQTCPGMVKQRCQTGGRGIIDQLLVPDNEETRAHFRSPAPKGRPRSGGQTDPYSARASQLRLALKRWAKAEDKNLCALSTQTQAELLSMLSDGELAAFTVPAETDQDPDLDF